ncbi:hypothetical protein ABEP16_27220 [Priestia aryabhattai]|uniref:hypothetical protein n=1 Tax=Priestia aryabhattai TaxID=412384 RepID=UPI003D271815
MRKVVKLQTVNENNKATQVWMQHLINRILMEQLDLPVPLAAKVVYQSSKQWQRKEDDK